MTIAMVARLKAMLRAEAGPRTQTTLGRRKAGATPMIMASDTRMPAREERFPSGEGFSLRATNDVIKANPADARTRTSSVVRAIANLRLSA